MSINATISFNDELHAILRIRAEESKQPFATYVQSLLWAAVRGEQTQSSNTTAETPATVDPKTTVKHLRDQLKRSKKVSPMKTELLALLTDILKDGPKESDAPSTLIVPITEPVHDEDAERAMDDYLEQRRQANINRSGGMQSIGNAVSSMFAPGGALERAANRGNVDTAEIRKVLDSSKAKDAPEPTDDDWFPEE